MFSAVVTLFNFYETSEGEGLWYPHILKGTHLETDLSASLATTGTEGSDSVALHVIFTEADGRAYIDGQPCLPPKAWRSQEEESLAESITFNEDHDFFMIGEWDGESPVKDSDYTDRRTEGFFAYMNANKDGVYRITRVKRYNVIKHFEITGA